MPPEGLYHLHNGLNIALRPKASCFVICFWIKTLLVFATIQKKKKTKSKQLNTKLHEVKLLPTNLKKMIFCQGNG